MKRTSCNLAVLRVVVRRGFTHDMADLLLADVKRQVQRLEKQPEPRHDPGARPRSPTSAARPEDA